MLVTLAALALAVQAAAASSELQQANDLYQAGDWTAAERAYAAIVRTSPESAQAHFRLAVALANLNRHAESIPHLATAEKLGIPVMQVALRLAVAHAHAGNRDAAFRELTRGASFGLTALSPPLDTDPAIAALRSDPRFKAFETALDRNARPCEHNPKYRELDFWLGDWEARNVNAPRTSPPASSAITKIHNGCVILETWQSPGYSGQSFNIYDRSRKQWHQTWVDSTGGLHEYWGNLKDGNMVYEGMIPPTPGQSGPQQTRMTFFNLGDGKVRQFVERSTDGGKTWVVGYDFIYTKKP
jgi:tetratricopeptide (TPR) repeat protein